MTDENSKSEADDLERLTIQIDAIESVVRALVQALSVEQKKNFDEIVQLAWGNAFNRAPEYIHDRLVKTRRSAFVLSGIKNS